MQGHDVSDPSLFERFPNSLVADHDLLRIIGQGAYGEVWLARHRTLGTLRAVKVVKRDGAGDASALRREFEGVKRFEPISRTHPNLVSVLHVGGDQDRFYYVMELADSNPQSMTGPSGDYRPHTLRSEMKNSGSLPVERCIQVGSGVASALMHLHTQGLIHRDVKPSNIIFVKGVPKLADMGLVTGADESRSFVGTEGYIPPEGPGSASADCYSLGKMLYELSSGRDRNAWPEPAYDLSTRADREKLLELNAILHRACSPKKEDRYSDGREMWAELQLLQRGESIKQKRTRELHSLLWKRAAGAVVTLVILMIIVNFGRSKFTLPQSWAWPLSTNMHANILCDQGVTILRADRYEEFPKAYANFSRAIELDSGFARPWSGLLELAIRESNPDAKGKLANPSIIATKLKALAPRSAASHCANSIVSFYDLNFPAAENEALRTIAADPQYEFGHNLYCWMLICWGRLREAREQARIGEQLAPGKSIVYRAYGNIAFAERNYAEAIKWYEQTLDVESHHAVALNCIGSALETLGEYTNALAHLERSDLLTTHDQAAVKERFAKLREALEKGGPRGYWEQQWNFAQAEPGSGYYEKAKIQMKLGNQEAALDYLEKSFATRERDGPETIVTILFWDDSWDVLHDHLRFKALVEKIGFSKAKSPKH